MPARRPSGGGCSCIGGKVVDEVDEKVEKSMFWWRTVGWLSRHLAPGAWARRSYPGGAFQGAAGWLGPGCTPSEIWGVRVV